MSMNSRSASCAPVFLLFKTMLHRRSRKGFNHKADKETGILGEVHPSTGTLTFRMDRKHWRKICISDKRSNAI